MGCASQTPVAPVCGTQIDAATLENALTDIKTIFGLEQGHLLTECERADATGAVFDGEHKSALRRLKMLRLLLSDRGVYGLCRTDFDAGEEPPALILANLSVLNGCLESSQLRGVLDAAAAAGAQIDDDCADLEVKRAAALFEQDV